MTPKISHKVIKGITSTKAGAQRMKKRLQKESPHAAFRIYGSRKSDYRVYQIWYDNWSAKQPWEA